MSTQTNIQGPWIDEGPSQFGPDRIVRCDNGTSEEIIARVAPMGDEVATSPGVFGRAQLIAKSPELLEKMTALCRWVVRNTPDMPLELVEARTLIDPLNDCEAARDSSTGN